MIMIFGFIMTLTALLFCHLLHHFGENSNYVQLLYLSPGWWKLFFNRTCYFLLIIVDGYLVITKLVSLGIEKRLMIESIVPDSLNN